MNTARSTEPRIRQVAVSDESITAHLADGRTVIVPLSWSWRLSEATAEQRQNSRFWDRAREFGGPTLTKT